MLVNREDLARDAAYYRGVAERAERAGSLGDGEVASRRLAEALAAGSTPGR